MTIKNNLLLIKIAYNMKKSTLIILLSLIILPGYAQKIHSSIEILKIMSASKIGYQIATLSKPITATDYSEKLNYHDSYRLQTDSSILTKQYRLSEKSSAILQKAEMYFQAKDIDNALITYKSVLESDSTLYFVMTYIGQIYEDKGDHTNAIIWYKKAINKNYIDYMAHWFLADNYKAINDLKGAVEEITVARILNRNNRRIKKSFDNIFLKAKRDTTDWYFNPQVEITKVDDKTVNVLMDAKWVGYGMCKALWKCEPGYSESMGVEKGKYSTLEDRECLVSELIALTNAKIKIDDDKQLLVLRNTVDAKSFEEYILYEIVLPKQPAVAYQLPQSTIESIKNYILNVRNK